MLLGISMVPCSVCDVAGSWLPRFPHIDLSLGRMKPYWSTRLNLALFSDMDASFIWSCVVHSSLTGVPSISFVRCMFVNIPDLCLPCIVLTRLAWLHCFSFWQVL